MPQAGLPEDGHARDNPRPSWDEGARKTAMHGRTQEQVRSSRWSMDAVDLHAEQMDVAARLEKTISTSRRKGTISCPWRAAWRWLWIFVDTGRWSNTARGQLEENTAQRWQERLLHLINHHQPRASAPSPASSLSAATSKLNGFDSWGAKVRWFYSWRLKLDKQYSWGAKHRFNPSRGVD
jgi:hypothetical protein